MVKIAQREKVDVYTIPPNFAQEGTIFSGRVRLRNAFEAGVLALLLFQLLMATNLSVKGKIYAGIIVTDVYKRQDTSCYICGVRGTGGKPDFFFISVSEIPVGAKNTYSSRRQISFKKESQIKKTAIPEPEWKRRRAS